MAKQVLFPGKYYEKWKKPAKQKRNNNDNDCCNEIDNLSLKASCKSIWMCVALSNSDVYFQSTVEQKLSNSTSW